MGVAQAMGAALSGLRTTQAGLSVLSQNIANADSVGYTRRVLTTEQQISGDRTTGSQVAGIERMLDALLQRQLRLETAGAAYTGVRASYAASLDRMFGQPGSASALDATLNAFTQSLQGLIDDPASYSARAAALSGAANLAAQISSLAQDVQSLRSNAEAALSTNVQTANDLLGQIQTVNARIIGSGTDGPTAGLLDQRDQLIDGLSRLMDLRVTELGGGSVSIITTGGLSLFDGVSAIRLAFDGRNSLAPQSLYDRDPSKRTVGTILALDPSGGAIDVLGANLIRSGEIAGLVELRDTVLVEAQNQLDQLAAHLASALSDKTAAGAAATAGAASGFDVDLAGLMSGNVVTLDYVDTPAGTARRVSFVRVEDATQLPLPASATADPSDAVFGISFAGGMASVAAQIQAALGGGFAVSNPVGNMLRILDDGVGATTDITGLAAVITVTGLTSGDPELPLFVDGGRANAAFTASFEGGSQTLGFAQRIVLNPAIVANASKLVVYDAGTHAGDTTRPELLLARLTGATRLFSPASGIGGLGAPYAGTVADFARRVVDVQGAAAQNIISLDEGQQLVLTSLQARFAETTGVNVDREMALLIQLQSAYAANARVITAAKEMLDMLLRI